MVIGMVVHRHSVPALRTVVLALCAAAGAGRNETALIRNAAGSPALTLYTALVCISLQRVIAE